MTLKARQQKAINKELTNETAIYLHKEKLFWVAYEKSAYLFHVHVRQYKLQRRKLKAVEKEVISLAFPDNVIDQITLPIISRTDEEIVIRAPKPIDHVKFDVWRAAIPLFVKNRNRRNEYLPTLTPPGEVVLRRFRDFDLTRSTPIDCLNFIHEMKQITARL